MPVMHQNMQKIHQIKTHMAPFLFYIYFFNNNSNNLHIITDVSQESQ